MVPFGDYGTKGPSKESVLSTLVHRAVSMPLQRPQAIDRGRGEVFEIAEAIKSAADELEAAFAMPLGVVKRDWSRARLLADAGGPWFDDFVREFFEVARPSNTDRLWVLDRLVPATARLADFLQQTAEGEAWRAVWAEVPLVIGPGSRRPSIKKADLIVFLENPNCYLSDLKVTTAPYSSWRAYKAKHAKRFRQCREVLSSRGFVVVGSYLLLADADGNRAPEWESVELG